MSELSKNLLSTSHKAVHDQFDCVYVAVFAYQTLHIDNDQLKISLRTHHKKIIKIEIKSAMKQIGFKPGFLRSSLGYYAYEFWEIITYNVLGGDFTEEQLIALSVAFLEGMADYLDAQYIAEGRADSIGFLKLQLA